MKKKNSYQKLKDKNIDLQQDILYLIKYPNTYDGILIKAKWEMIFAIEDQLWFGKSK